MRVTARLLSEATGLSEENAGPWVGPIRDAVRYADLYLPERLGMFLAQTGHESSGFRRLTENLNYSAAGLMATWPSRFWSPESAQELARQPERIANTVYADRLGNGPPESGDGWKFRGRGLIQVTGRANYRECGRALGVDLEADPEILTEPQMAALSAAWFWRARRLNEFMPDMLAITRRINGGTHGLRDRERRYVRALAAIPALDDGLPGPAPRMPYPIVTPISRTARGPRGRPADS